VCKIIYIHVYVCMYMYVHMYVCMYKTTTTPMPPQYRSISHRCFLKCRPIHSRSVQRSASSLAIGTRYRTGKDKRKQKPCQPPYSFAATAVDLSKQHQIAMHSPGSTCQAFFITSIPNTSPTPTSDGRKLLADNTPMTTSAICKLRYGILRVNSSYLVHTH
jgi:hypothetical protein